MKNKKFIWLIGTKLGKSSVTSRHLSKSYLIIHLETLQTMNNYLLSKEYKKPVIYIFAQEEATKYFLTDGETSIPSLSTIIIGSDHPTAVKAFYSIGLTNYLSPSSKYQLLAQIDLLLNSPVERPELVDLNWDNLTVKEKKILHVLSAAKNNQVSRDEIIATVWKSKQIKHRAFDVHLCHLRQKLENSRYKINWAGDGKYQFEITKIKKTRLIKNLKQSAAPFETSVSLQ